MSVENLKIHSVESAKFSRYGKVIRGFDSSEVVSTALNACEIPEEGVLYRASLDFIEELPTIKNLGEVIFGGIDVQSGWCIGRNRKLNALEYHKSSEIILGLTDLALILGLVSDIQDFRYPSETVEVFTLTAGTVVELYARTLHFAPQNVGPEGFAAIIMLPRGTNDQLKGNLIPQDREKINNLTEVYTRDPEFPLLWMENKWMICHPESPQAKKGAWVGITGENLELPENLNAPISPLQG